MATIAEKMAESLEILHQLQKGSERVVLNGTKQMSRTHLTRLMNAGYLQEVMKGWYISSKPGTEGDTTVWYTSYWYFIAKYATERFNDSWCLTAEQSLDLYSGRTTVPVQTIVRSPNGKNNLVNLMYGTSLFDLKAELPSIIHKHELYGLNMYTLEEALIYASPTYFQSSEIPARICLSMIKDVSGIVKILSDKGASSRAGRLAGAFRNMGNEKAAESILQFMKKIGYTVTEEDPFNAAMKTVLPTNLSPYANRLRLMWEKMKEPVKDVFPSIPEQTKSVDEYLKLVDEKYLEDAYHSLSIEGYRISQELIEKVRAGDWKPDKEDKEHKNALVARGYYQAFQAVKRTVVDIINGNNAGDAVEKAHGDWYFEMWSPFVEANLLKPSDLAGYRTGQVYIRGSLHTPLPPSAINDAMETLFDLLKNEEDSRVRAVLGHFFFVYIHPYMDGNGRMGRFLLNAMLASGGYNWTIVPVERRKEYMAALEKASVDEDISDFARIIAELASC